MDKLLRDIRGGVVCRLSPGHSSHNGIVLLRVFVDIHGLDKLQAVSRTLLGYLRRPSKRNVV